jgi:hypothetical protein
MAGEVLLRLVDLDVQLANGTESRVRGFADLTVGAGLQWAPKKIGNGVFVYRAMIDSLRIVPWSRFVVLDRQSVAHSNSLPRWDDKH